MFEEKRIQVIKCDNCRNEMIDLNTTKKHELLEEAELQGWFIDKLNHYCGNCHFYDEDENLIIKNYV